MKVNHSIWGRCSLMFAAALLPMLSPVLSSAKATDVGTQSYLSDQQPENRQAVFGTVVDQDGAPLPGASIRIKGVAGGTSSKADGSFSIAIPKGLKDVVLEVSFIGMTKRTIKYKGEKHLKVVLSNDENVLKEVVVTGYQTLKKNSFTGNATIVTRDELLKTNNKNAFAALQVFEPSFRIKEAAAWGSDPNRLPEFTIRGEGSLGTSRGIDAEYARRTQRTGLRDNPNMPIFILDGFEVPVQTIYDLDMNRIESMTILKDAAATALYGSRASNGVVVVMTIPPKPGEARVSYNLTGGIELPDLSDYNLAGPYEMLEIERLSGKYQSDDPAIQIQRDVEYNDLVNEVRRGVRTDWLAQPLRNAFNHGHSVNISGGVESIRYGVDLNYNTHNGAMKGSYRNTYGIALSLDYRLKGWLQLLNRTSYNTTKTEDSPYGNFEQYAMLKPYWTPYDNHHNLVEKVYDRLSNPLYQAQKLGSYAGRGTDNTLSNNLSVNLYFNDDLSFRGQFSVSKSDGKVDTFSDPKDPIYRTVGSTEKGQLYRGLSNGVNWAAKGAFQYKKAIGQHFINATLGAEANESNRTDISFTYKGFQLSNLNSPTYAAYQVGHKTPQNVDQSRLLGAYGALNYSYNDLYLLDLSYRLDGSSKFGSDKRFAPFWSAGLGLNMHKYEFMKNQDVISLLRFRGTYGTTGNVNFPSYAAITTYKTHTQWYVDTPANTLIALGNPALTWSVDYKLDLGMSIGLFNDRATLEAAYYHRLVADQISQLNIRTSSGFPTYYTNAGEIVNKGYELRLNAVPYQDKDWRVVVNATMAANTNRIKSLGQDAENYNKAIRDFYRDGIKGSSDSELDSETLAKMKYAPLPQYYVGASTTAIYAVKSLGIDPSTGQELFLKRNGMPTHVWDPVDMVVCGDKSPKAQGAFSINVSWRGFFVNASFLYQLGAQQYNQTLLDKVEQAKIDEGNVDLRVLTQRWQKPGDVAPFYDLKRKDKTQPTSRFVQNDDYLAFSGLSGGYDFNPSTVKSLGLTALGIRFNANELVRWSTIRQERGTSYPYAKNYSFTLTLGF